MPTVTLPPVERLDAYRLGWLAGMIDGEGSIGIYRRSDVRKRPNWRLVLTIGLTCEEAVRYIWHLTGCGSVQRHKPVGNRKPWWSWTAAGRQAVGVLLPVSPYLRIKQRHAAIALEFQRQRRDHPGRVLTSEETKVDSLLAGLLRAENARGPIV